MPGETLNVDETINAMEEQFEAVPHAVEQELTMLDLLGVEMPAPESTDMPLAPTASAFTDTKTKQGDGL
jgi:hypothetical protein